ncbi:hypothetical protein DITRI_Ditri03aG0070200 [Diplodiscus trichospermus]
MANSVESKAEYKNEPEELVLLRKRTKASDDDKEVEEEENKMPVSIWINDVLGELVMLMSQTVEMELQSTTTMTTMKFRTSKNLKNLENK